MFDPQTRRPGIVAAATLTLACLVTLVACREQKSSFDEQPRPVQWLSVEAGDHVRRSALSGALQPVATAELSFEVGGKIEQILVEPGDVVEKGEKLAQLETTSYVLDVRQKEGQLQDARARLEQARSDFTRKKNLLDSGAVSRMQYENSRSAYESARNQVESLKALLEISRENLQDTTLTAPYAGQISERAMEPSQQVQPGQAVLAIQNLEGLEVSVTIPETLVQQLPLGSRQEVRFAACPDLSVAAELTELSSRAGTSGSFPAVFQLEETPGCLKAGMTAEVLVELDRDTDNQGDNPLFEIPLTALLAQDGGGFAVFLFDEQSKQAEKKPVQVATLSQKSAFVLSGLEEGDILITHGASFLRDGQPVRLIGTTPNWYQD